MVLGRVMGLALGLSGCTGILGLDTPAKIRDASVTDGSADGGRDGGSADATIGSCTVDGLDVCGLTDEPSPRVFATNRTIDTSAGSTDCTLSNLALPSSPTHTACVIHAPNITIQPGIVLTVTGTQVLILAADDTLDVRGSLEVAAAANDSSCAAEAQVPDSYVTGGGGGAGGSFGSIGGAGGWGAKAAARQGKPPPSIGLPAYVRGGCPGYAGGTGNIGGTAGTGGSSGGGTWLVARNKVSISGAVLARGQGGKAGVAATTGGTTGGGGGGGGGGTGGYVRIAAANLIDISGVVAANGGGGGGGGACCTQPNGNGGDGQPGNASGTAASGGTAGFFASGAGAGGAGNATNVITPVAASPGYTAPYDNAGGGGGGGGAGFVALRVAPTLRITGTISPPPSP